MKANNIFHTFKIEVLNGMQEIPLGFRTMLAEGVPASHPPRPRSKVETIYSPIDRYARQFARQYPEVGYLEADDPDEGDTIQPTDDLTLSRRTQRRNERDTRNYYSSVNEDDDISPEEFELELSQDAFNFANFKISAMKKGLSEEQAHHQAIRDIFNTLEQREIELNLIRQQANAIGIPSFDPQRHLSYLSSLYKTINDRREEYVFMMHRDELEESLRLKKYYGETAPVTFEQVSHFSPEEYDQFIAEHPEYKELLAQPIKLPNQSDVKESSKKNKQSATAAKASSQQKSEASLMEFDEDKEMTTEEKRKYLEANGIPIPKDGVEFQEEEIEQLMNDKTEILKRVVAYRTLLENLEEDELELLNKEAGYDLLEELDTISLELQMEIGRDIVEEHSPAEEDEDTPEPFNEYGFTPSDYQLNPDEDNIAIQLQNYGREKGLDKLLANDFDPEDFPEDMKEFFNYTDFKGFDESSGDNFSLEVDSFKEKLNEMENTNWINLNKNDFIRKVFHDNRSPFANLEVAQDGTLTKSSSTTDSKDLFKTKFVDRLWSTENNIEYPVFCSREAINDLNKKKQISPELAKYFNVEMSGNAEEVDTSAAAGLPKLQQYYSSDLANFDTFQELNRFQDVPPTTYKAAINIEKFNDAYEKTLENSIQSIYVNPMSAIERINLAEDDEADELPNLSELADQEEDPETRNLLLMLKTSNELDSTTEKIRQLNKLFSFKENEQIEKLLAEKDNVFGGKELTVEDYVKMDDATFERLSGRVNEIDTQIKKLQAVATLKENLAVRYSDRYRRQKAQAIERIRNLQRRQVELEKRLNRIERATPIFEKLIKKQAVASPIERAAEAVTEGISTVDSHRAREQILNDVSLPLSQQLIQSVWPTIDLETKKRILAQFKQQKLQQKSQQKQEQQNVDSWYLNNNNNKNQNNVEETITSDTTENSSQYDPKNYKNLKDLFYTK